MMVYVARCLFVSNFILIFTRFHENFWHFHVSALLFLLLREVVSFIGLYGCYRNLPPLPGAGRTSMKCRPHMTKGVWQVLPIDSGHLGTPPKIWFHFLSWWFLHLRRWVLEVKRKSRCWKRKATVSIGRNSSLEGFGRTSKGPVEKIEKNIPCSK